MLPTWFWFVVALVAAGGGALLLLSDRKPDSSSSGRARRRWAEQKSWEVVDSDDALAARWHYGTFYDAGSGRAADLVTGAVPGPGGRRLAHVFDHERDGEITGVVAAVRGVATLPVALELRLPSAPLPEGAGLDSLGQVGKRYAFVTGTAEGRGLLTSEVERTADLVGDDVALVWAEDTWVLAEARPGTSPERMQRVLQALVELSVALEKAVDGDPDPTDDPTDSHEPVTPTGDAGATDPTDHDADDSTDHDADDDLPPEVDDDTAEIPPPTHRDRPGDIPYDLARDEPGADAGRAATKRR